MAPRFLTAALILLVWPAAGLAQNNSYVITIATGDTLSGCSLVSLADDSLYIRWSGFPVSLPVESIQRIRYLKKSEFWHGAMIGTAIGGVAGTLAIGLGSGAGREGAQLGITGIAAGFLVGGLTAEYFSRDERYDLARATLAEKKEVLGVLVTRTRIPTDAER